jgi:hypothetical protein
MADEPFRIAELLLDGYTCAHILMKLALDDEPDTHRISPCPSL